jgi:putative flippase GtrA
MVKRVLGALRRIYRDFRLFIHEVSKFGVVGLIAYLIDFGLANVLHDWVWHIGPVTSKAISTIVAATFSYFANRHWTWRDRARVGLFHEYSRFFILTLIGLAITELCVAITFYGLDERSPLAYNLSANVVGVILATVFRFWSFKRYVFLEVDPQQRVEESIEAALQ